MSGPPVGVNFYPLTDQLQRGMIPLSIFALCSALSTFTLLSWITYRLVWRQDYQAFVGYNQYVILIYNLLLADFQQSLAFLITLNWLKVGGMESPSTVCFAQAWLLNMGDVSSGFFVFAIALHTWYSVVLGRKLNYAVFTTSILGIWAAAFLLTIMGPATKGPHFFAKTNAWCWINSQYDLYRLWFHYMWVFMVEFGTIMIYAHVFLHLRKRLHSIRSVHAHAQNRSGGSTNRLSQAARYMVLYPVIYVVLTLPLAAGRMAAMSGKTLPIWYYCMAGSFLTSCGWLDTLLYTLTRRVFVKPERPQTQHSYNPSATANSSRRWLSGARSGRSSTAPPLPDPNWPLSTFASVTIDFKDGDEAYSESSGIGGEAYVRVGTPAQMDESRVVKKMALTETTIRAMASDAANEETERPENGILSETRIEVVTISRDDIMEHDLT